MSLLKSLQLTSRIFFLAFAMSLVSAQNDLELSPQSDTGSLDEIQELLQKVQSLIASKVQQGTDGNEQMGEEDLKVDGEIDVPRATAGCSCSGVTCTCCNRIYVAKLGINQNYCVIMTAVPRVGTIEFTLKADWKVLMSQKISVSNPQSFCVYIACRQPGVKICFQFNSLRLSGGWLSGCSNVIVYCPGGWAVANVNLGCFNVHCISVAPRVEGLQSPLYDPQSNDQVQALYEEKIAPNVQPGTVGDEQMEEKDLKADKGEIDAPRETTGCSCSRLSCTCCKRICVPKLGINHNYCLSMTYVPSWGAIQFTLKADWKVLVSQKVSVKNPHKICVAIPCRMQGVKVCLQFYGLHPQKGGWFSGCSKVVVYCPAGVVAIVNLGCFRVHCVDVAPQVEGPQSPLYDPLSIPDQGEMPMEVLTPARYDGKL